MSMSATRILVALCLAVSLSACWGPNYRVPDNFAEAPKEVVEEEELALRGDELAQRKLSLERAYSDLEHFHDTLVSLRYRKNRNGTILFVSFLESYMSTYLDPMLANRWQAKHPDMKRLDANVRFAQTELLRQMKDGRRVRRNIKDIKKLFKGSEDLVIDYPYGETHPLGESLVMLRKGKRTS
ncbi:MAG: hypothetical protein HKP27_14235 [Myxococcales bacterium]|nr:hypothetical protein [Myxococcales bacterium]